MTHLRNRLEKLTKKAPSPFRRSWRRETGCGETVKTRDDDKARRETAERKGMGRVVLLSD
jgi:hypothetical protein